jgi:hypothetical protein
MNKLSLSALVAAGLLAGGMSITSASAADLGGNCCADLEERIAELEATTARKGNRKVSLTISGWVAEQVMWWDDGEESNVYVTGIGTTLASHVKFTGEAQIVPGWSAGYVLHLEADQADTLFLNQDDDDNDGAGLNVFQSYWFVKSDTYGKVSIGKQSPGSDNAAILVDGSGSLVPANWVLFDNSSFFLRTNNAFVNANGVTWGDLGFCNISGLGIGGDCVGVPGNYVRYDTPVWGGFSATFDWGEDDTWDITGRYSGEHYGFKVAGVVSWAESNDLDNTVGGDKVGYFQAGLYVQHIATGLFGYGAYGFEDLDDLDAFDAIDGNDDRPDHWYLKAGLRRRWHPLGHTVLYAEYAKRNNMLANGAADLGLTFVPFEGFVFGPNGESPGDIVDAELKQWGLGIVQEVDAAAMSFWLSYKHFSADAELRNGDDVSIDDFDLVKFGALINF